MVTSRRGRIAVLGAATAAAVTAAVVVPAGADARTEGRSAGASGQQRTVFFDNFAGHSVDTSKWNIDVTQSTQYNNELEAYTTSRRNVRIVHGAQAAGARDHSALELQARYQPGFTTPAGNKLDFTSGKIDSANKFDLNHGTISARMKLPAGIGYWPAFWLLGYGNWPDTGEIDVMENIGDPRWVSAATHGPGYSGDQAPVNRAYLRAMGLQDVPAWHTYTLHWPSRAMTFYVDGKVFFNETRAMIEFFGKWAFNNPKYLILNLALGGIYPYKMTGVTTPYYGLDQQTFDSVKAGQGKVLVDWVRVTQRT